MKFWQKIIFVFAIFLLANSSQIAYSQTATLLPNAEQVFISENGAPYAGGSVYMYIPNTTSFKTTWQDSAGSVPNTNPVILDSAGRAIIYGIGQYRQILKDSDGNQVWDRLTQDVYSLISQGSAIWGGTSTGTVNALLLTSSPLLTSLAIGQVIAFTAGNTNTGPSTANISGLGVKNILVTTQAGTATLISGNITVGGRYFMFYDGAEFILLNPTSGVSGNGFVTLASNTTTDLGSASTTNVLVTGSNTITSFGSSATTNNPLFVVQFTGSLQVTYNASTMITPNAQNLITQAGDYALMRYLGTSGWQVLSYFPASGYIGKIVPQTYTAGGTYTYTAPPNLLYDDIEIVGAGGGGGAVTVGAGGSAGGGGGGYAKVQLTSAQIGPTQSISIGVGGGLGIGGGGGNGGTTSFGTLISCTGGAGGSIQGTGGGSGNVAGGASGSCSTTAGIVEKTIPGQQGGYGANNAFIVGGAGGSTPLGFGGPTIAGGPNANGLSGSGNGSGGSGCIANSSTICNGGSGTDGSIVITQYLLR
jgi:hypothetical protein